MINFDIFKKNEKGKYIKVDEMKTKGIYVLQDMLNYSERKLDGEKIKIVKHYDLDNYNYTIKTNIDIYFNNGYKYIYYDIPCTSLGYINSQELLEEF